MKETHVVETLATANRLIYSPDGLHIAVAEGRGGSQSPPESEVVEVFHTDTAEKVAVMSTGGGEYVFDAAYSHDGKLLATANGEAVYIWDAISGESLARFDVEADEGRVRYRTKGLIRNRHVYVRHRAFTVTFSPDDKRIAAGWGRRSDNVIIWDVGLGKESLAANWKLRADSDE